MAFTNYCACNSAGRGGPEGDENPCAVAWAVTCAVVCGAIDGNASDKETGVGSLLLSLPVLLVAFEILIIFGQMGALLLAALAWPDILARWTVGVATVLFLGTLCTLLLVFKSGIGLN